MAVRGTVLVERPGSCAGDQLRSFAGLVLEGFPGARDLERRIAGARALAFHYTAEGTLAGVAALKLPGEAHRDGVFRNAAASVGPGSYDLELGWVFVLPARRGQRVATGLCRRLLASARGAPVFATTRTDNLPMRRILGTLGFRQTGRPYARRDEELLLFLRPSEELMEAARRE